MSGAFLLAVELVLRSPYGSGVRRLRKGLRVDWRT